MAAKTERVPFLKIFFKNYIFIKFSIISVRANLSYWPYYTCNQLKPCSWVLPVEGFLEWIIEVGKPTLPLSHTFWQQLTHKDIKERSFGFLLPCPHSPKEIYLPCYWGIPSLPHCLVLGTTFFGFQHRCRLKTISSLRVLQDSVTKLDLLGHLVSWTEKLPGSDLSTRIYQDHENHGV